jgi:hypothetical protein
MITIEPERQDPAAMYLREQIATGTDPATGVKIELSLTNGGLVLELQRSKADGEPFGTGRTVETIPFGKLVEAWASSVLQEQT